MVDPTSDVGSVSPSEAPTCEACEATIQHRADHRVVTWIADGQVQTAHFCDEGCRREWDGEAT
jgi:hypothetical protein